jgi:hypothetical protein
MTVKEFEALRVGQYAKVPYLGVARVVLRESISVDMLRNKNGSVQHLSKPADLPLLTFSCDRGQFHVSALNAPFIAKMSFLSTSDAERLFGRCEQLSIFDYRFNFQ